MTDAQNITPEERDEMYEFLHNLRLSGAVNMFEAPSILQDEFGLTKREAIAVFVEWTGDYRAWLDAREAGDA